VTTTIRARHIMLRQAEKGITKWAGEIAYMRKAKLRTKTLWP